MITGVSFQPGQDPTSSRTGGTPQSDGVQEAIKVLSLRLPRVVGANALSPSSLLQSPGSNGRIDSVVAQVLQQLFPTGGGAPAQAPNVGSMGQGPMGPQVTGAASGGVSPTTHLRDMLPPMGGPTPPRITPGGSDIPPRSPIIPDPGSPTGPGTVEEVNPMPPPDPPAYQNALLEMLARRKQDGLPSAPSIPAI